MGFSIGGLIGGVVGFVVGGPQGAAIGYSLGSGVDAAAAQREAQRQAQRQADEASAQAAAAQRAADAAAAAARGIVVNAASTVAGIPVVYGQRKIGGNRVFVGSSGATNGWLHVVLAHAEGEIDGVQTVWFDDVLSTDARFTNKFTKEHYTGADDQAACAALMTALPAKWTSAHRLRGVAYTYLKLKYDTNAWHGIPECAVLIKGRKVYDPRTSQTAWSDNPALCVRDYLTNTRYGRGIATADLDGASFIAAADYCDELISTPAGNRKRYTCNGLVSIDTDTLSNLQDLLTSMRAMLIYSGGKYRLRCDKEESPTFAFTEDNITGGWRIDLPSKRGRFNRARVGWVNPDDRWQPDIAVIDSPSWRATDNGLLLETQIELKFTTDPYQAQMLGQRFVKQSRFGIVATFDALISGMLAEVGDVVTLTHSTPGWTAKPFRITRIVLKSNDEVSITAAEYDASVYANDPLTTPRTSTVTDLPNPFQVTTPSGLACASGTDELIVTGDGTVVSRVKVSWDVFDDAFVENGGGARVQYKATTAADWLEGGWAAAGAGPLWLAPVIDGTTYDVRVRLENTLGKVSAWTATTHQVVGKTAAPSNVTGFSAVIAGDRVEMAWSAVADADLADYEIRLGATWATATLLTRARGTAHTYVPTTTGTLTFLVKARDTTGNYSATAASAEAGVSPPGMPSVSITSGASPKVAVSWPGVAGSTTVTGYEVRLGATWATATVLGVVAHRTGIGGATLTHAYNDTVTTIGTHRYWVAAVAAAGVGTPASADAEVTMPPAPADWGIAQPSPNVSGRTPFLHLIRGLTPALRDDVQQVEIHISPTSGFTPSAATAMKIPFGAQYKGQTVYSILLTEYLSASGTRRYFSAGTTYYVRVGYPSSALDGGTVELSAQFSGVARATGTRSSRVSIR